MNSLNNRLERLESLLVELSTQEPSSLSGPTLEDKLGTIKEKQRKQKLALELDNLKEVFYAGISEEDDSLKIIEYTIRFVESNSAKFGILLECSVNSGFKKDLAENLLSELPSIEDPTKGELIDYISSKIFPHTDTHPKGEGLPEVVLVKKKKKLFRK